jgi:hypothetical protein
MNYLKQFVGIKFTSHISAITNLSVASSNKIAVAADP